MAAENRTAEQDAIALRRTRALELRAKCKTFQEIADELGVSIGTAHTDVRAAMSEYAKEAEGDAQAERGLQLRRLDRALDVVERVLNDDDPESKELTLKALDRLVKLEEQRAKLLGLYAPEKRDISASVVGDVSPEAAARLVRETFGAAALPKDDPPAGDAEPGSAPAVPGTPGE